jgi:ABC-2 type transport system ATP-binding protein
MTTAGTIEVEGLVKRYRKATTPAVDGVSFEVAGGEFFALLGPNGAGKTTTISVLTTTLQPTAGTVRVAGHDVVRDAAAVRRRIGIIFQQPSLDLNLTGEHNVRLHAMLYGLAPYRPSYRSMPRSYRDKVDDLTALLGIEREMFKPVRTLSGGTKRKLEILRSLLHRPSLLFLDEPTAGLDAASRRELWSYLRQVQAESGTTVLLTTHYLEEAEGADRICIISGGRVVATGSPAQLTRRLVDRRQLVLDAGDRDRLRGELLALGVAFDETPEFRVAVGDEDAHQLLRAIETPLTLVRTHAATVEDAYLDIVGTGA